MTMCCPRCHSAFVVERNLAKKTVSALGAAGGVIGGIMASMNDEPPDAATTVLTGFTAGLAAGAAGAKLGEFIDKNILDNYQCPLCGYVFGQGHI